MEKKYGVKGKENKRKAECEKLRKYTNITQEGNGRKQKENGSGKKHNIKEGWRKYMLKGKEEEQRED